MGNFKKGGFNMSIKKEAPRFHPKYRRLVSSLEIPEGKKLAKLEGHPVIISDRKPGEPLMGNQFTERQLRELADLVTHKRIGLGVVPFPATVQDLSNPHASWRLTLAHDAPNS